MGKNEFEFVIILAGSMLSAIILLLFSKEKENRKTLTNILITLILVSIAYSIIYGPWR